MSLNVQEVDVTPKAKRKNELCGFLFSGFWSLVIYYRCLGLAGYMIGVEKIPLFLFFFFFSLFNLFIFGCVGSSLLRVGFLQLQRVGATLCCGMRASHCGGFSCCGAQALGTWASVIVALRLSSCGSWALEHRLCSCGTQA